MKEKTRRSTAKIIAVIPCFNEENFIGDIVTRARIYADKVIVIDDGSTDNTSEVAKAAGAEVIRHERRRGAGAATKSGFEAAKTNNADILVTLDGDRQHDPDEIPQVLAPILSCKADLVIGSRFLQPNLNQSQPISTRYPNIANTASVSSPGFTISVQKRGCQIPRVASVPTAEGYWT